MSIRFFSQVFSPNSDKGADSTIRISLQHTYGDGKMEKIKLKDTRLAIYYRISTMRARKKDKDGNLIDLETTKYTQTIAMQKHAIHKYLREDLGMTDAEIAKIPVYQDLNCSGKKNTVRPDFRRLQNHITKGKIDNVVCFRLDRMSRDAVTAIQLLLDFDKYGVGFIATDQPELNLSTNNPFRLTIISAFSEIAQIERETIVRRIKIGIEAAKKRGVTFGQPTKSTAEIDNIILRMHFKKNRSGRSIANHLAGVVGRTYVQNLINEYKKKYEGEARIEWIKSLIELPPTDPDLKEA